MNIFTTPHCEVKLLTEIKKNREIILVLPCHISPLKKCKHNIAITGETVMNEIRTHSYSKY